MVPGRHRFEQHVNIKICGCDETNRVQLKETMLLVLKGRADAERELTQNKYGVSEIFLVPKSNLLLFFHLNIRWTWFRKNCCSRRSGKPLDLEI
jgi:hypothetical protein